MQICRGITELKDRPTRCVLTIGNFDGVHLGHRKIFQSLLNRARELNGTPAIVTFKPHPQIALRPEKKLELLNTYAEKLEFFKDLGIRLVVEEPFSREFSNTSAEEFVQNYLLQKLDVKVLYLGYDFAFGKERKGSAQFIEKLAADQGVEVHEVSAYEYKGEPVSSSRIRTALDAGDIPLANELLGRRFFLRGLVVKGVGRGRTIQVPTANLALELRKLPRIGVYATRTKIDGKFWNSITNVGVSPTFHSGKEDVPIVVETHILDFNGNVYGNALDVEFLEFIRPEKKFASAIDLVDQIQKDIAVARRIQAR